MKAFLQYLVCRPQTAEHNARRTPIFALLVIGVLVIGALGTDAYAGTTYTYYADGRIRTVTYDPPQGGVAFEQYLDEDVYGFGYGRVQKRVLASADADGAVAYEYVNPYPTVIVAADLDGDGIKDDLLVDFGGKGFYKYTDNSSWTLIGAAMPKALTVADLDENGKDDIVIDYGPQYGLWKYVNGTTLTQIGSASPEMVVAADLDGNGKKDDLIIDYGPQYGLYKYENGATMTRIGTASPESVYIADLDENGKDDIVIDYGPQYGLWKYVNGTTLTQIGSASPEMVVAADLDGNGKKDDLIIDYGPQYGLYKYENGATMTKIGTASPESVTVADLDSNGKDDLMIDYGAYGIYKYLNGTTLAQIATLNADRETIKYAYGSSDFTGLVYTSAYDPSGNLIKKTYAGDLVTHYSDTGLMESKTLATADASGNIYYHYINENWAGQGYGRLDRSKRASALNGELCYSYAYYADAAGRLRVKTAYSDADWTAVAAIYTYSNDAAARLVKKETQGETITYYADTGYMESKKLASADASGNVYYHYLDENWNGLGWGRADKSVLASANDDGAVGFEYTYFNGGSEAQFVKAYANASYTDPSAPSFTGLKTEAEYWDSTYRLKTKKVYETAGSGYPYAQYAYYDESFYPNGTGRLKEKIEVQAAAPSAMVIYDYLEYHSGTDKIKVYDRRTYDGWTYQWTQDINGIVLVKKEIYGGVVKTQYTYYNDANNRMESKTLAAPDASGNVYYHYLNEDWQGQGYGRADKIKKATALNGELSFIFTYYSDASGRLKEKKAYSDPAWTTLAATYTFANDPANRLVSKVAGLVTYNYNNNAANRMYEQLFAMPDAGGNNYYRYLDEDWQGQGYGRLERSRRSEALNGELSYTYTYYADANGRLQTKTAYSDMLWSISVAIYTYANDSSNRLISKTLTEDGVQTAYTYYNDAAGRMESKTLAAADTAGNIYYHYMNENWAGQGYGRVDKAKKMTSVGDLGVAFTYAYFADANGRLQAKTAYSDSNWTTLAATVTYFNDAANRMESKTLTAQDNYGNVYYHYLNDDTGRMDKSKRASALNGELSFTYAYYADANGRLRTKTAYSDANWTIPAATYTYANDAANRLISKTVTENGIQVTYTYYNDATGRMESKMLASADASGNIYYHYINEDWAGRGYGRIDTQARQTANTDGAIGYVYAYYSGSVQAQYKKGYSTVDLANVSSPVLSNLAAEYEYYQTSGFLKKKTAYDTPGVMFPYTVYSYMDEDFYGDGTGRLTSKYIQSAGHPMAYQSYVYSSYYEGTDKVKTYSHRNYGGGTDWELDIDGHILQEKQYYFTTLKVTINYYPESYGPAHYMRDKTYPDPDQYGNSYYHYLNENWNGRGYGRVDKQASASAAADGSKAYEFEYFAGTDMVSLKKGYRTADYSNPASPIFTDQAVEYAYYATGNIKTKKTSPVANWSWNQRETWTYLDENFYGNGSGRLYQYEFNPASPHGVIRRTYLEYWTGTDVVKKMEEFIADSTLNTYTYYADARMESKTEGHGDGNNYYHYMDEDWAGRGYGRMDKSALYTALEGALSFTYAYYADVTGRLQTTTGYFTANWTRLVSIKTYANDADNRLIKKELRDSFGIVTRVYTYYNDATNRMEYQAQPSQSQGYSTYYHYINENFNNQGYGRMDVEGVWEGYAPYPDGSMGYVYTYFADSAQVQYKKGYGTMDFTDPSNPAYSDIKVEYEYDASGRMVKKTDYVELKIYEYYASGNLKSVQESLSGVYIYWPPWETNTYYDEDFYGNKQGRLYQYEYNPASHHGVIRRTYTDYWTGTDVVKKMEEFIADSTFNVYTYYATGKMESKVMYQGNTYYHYVNENWQGQGYGRVDKEAWTTAFADGSKGYTYTYFEGSAQAQYKDGYTTADFTDPTNPSYSGLKVRYEYNTSGSMISQTIYPDMTVYDYYASGNLKTKSVYYYTIGSGNVHRYTYADEDFYGNRQGRLLEEYDDTQAPHSWTKKTFQYWTGTDKVQVMEQLWFYGNKDKYEYASNGTTLLKKTNYGPTGTVLSVFWYFNDANNRMSKMLQADGTGYSYYNDATNRMEKKWETSGVIYHYTNEDLGGGYGRNDWEINASHNRLYVYRDFYSGTRYPHYKDTYALRAGTTDTWDFSQTDIYNTGWSWTGSTTNRSAVGNPPASTTKTIPSAPVASDPYSMLVLGTEAEMEAVTEYTVESEKLQELKASATGEGVTVAILDSGIGETDVTGHGTKMAETVKGVASGAGILDAKVLDAQRDTTSETVAEAIRRSADMGARVLSMSFGLYPVYGEVKEAIDYAASKGVVMIAAAGNSASEILDNSLAAQDKVITVGSVDKDGKVSAWSNYGSEVDLYAPWDVIEGQGAGVKGQEAGTSYSAAFVAGLTALILEDNPDYTADDVLAELKLIAPILAGTVKAEAEVKAKVETKIKGVSVNEVVSMQEAIRKQDQEFTGLSVKESLPAAYGPKGTDTLMPELTASLPLQQEEMRSVMMYELIRRVEYFEERVDSDRVKEMIQWYDSIRKDDRQAK